MQWSMGLNENLTENCFELAAGSSFLKSILLLCLVRDFAGFLKYLQKMIIVKKQKQNH